jgi:hypothetical protein
MNIGIDFHNVIDAYPIDFRFLAHLFFDTGHEVHVVSAIGPKRVGTIENAVKELYIPYTAVHEVVFQHPKEAPVLKADKGQQLWLSMHFDDRQDVCDEMNRRGILCFKVPRIGDKNDIDADTGQ